jgi:hypothetical protein
MHCRQQQRSMVRVDHINTEPHQTVSDSTSTLIILAPAAPADLSMDCTTGWRQIS